jgi:anaerobic magnesium-protoporphyrin IX monomethyl ester cyclase
MRISLVGAELEENLGLRYMAAALEHAGHEVDIVPFNSEDDLARAIEQVNAFNPGITGLSMVFTGRAREFCRFAQGLRDGGYPGHIIAGGHFASFNCERLLEDFPAFDSVGLGEGEELICALADHPEQIASIPGICYRTSDGSLVTNPSTGNPENLDALPFPKRTTFHEYYGKRIASILSSRGCWRNCAFCSINAWYERVGGKKFRVRGVANIVAEMKELYFQHGVRIFNFQDDNFFLPNPEKARRRFEELRDGLKREGVEGIAIAVKARPDSINDASIRVLDDLGLFRVFLGVENASQNGLRNLNRKCELDEILNALRVLNDFDIHVAFNILMFEPDTVMDDILINLRFIERHIDNPFNFCRAEAYAGTGLEAKLAPEGRLLGNYFGFDYRLTDARCEAFHQIANYAFFDRNFSDYGLHYFNMQVDFCFQLLRRFHPELLTESARAAVRNFIKQTNLDTYQCLCGIYDFVIAADPEDQVSIRSFARQMRVRVDDASAALHGQGQAVLDWLTGIHEQRDPSLRPIAPLLAEELPFRTSKPMPYRGLASVTANNATAEPGWFGVIATPIPYSEFKNYLAEQSDRGVKLGGG